MRLSFLRKQLVRSSEQLVLVDTKRVLGPGNLSETFTKYENYAGEVEADSQLSLKLLPIRQTLERLAAV